jgi:hypothetical protein
MVDTIVICVQQHCIYVLSFFTYLFYYDKLSPTAIPADVIRLLIYSTKTVVFTIFHFFNQLSFIKLGCKKYFILIVPHQTIY